MILLLTVKDIRFIHDKVKAVFPDDIVTGRISDVAIEGILNSAFGAVYGQPLHDTVIKQAAALLEGIIRLHPFPDGNKRTALLATLAFLILNDHYMVVPMNVNRFMVDIARNTSYHSEDNTVLLENIAKWIAKLTTTTTACYTWQWYIYAVFPVIGIAFLMFTKIGAPYARRKIRYWLATDVRPEYDKDLQGTLGFIFRLNLLPPLVLMKRRRKSNKA